MVRVLPELTGPSLKFRLVRQKTDIPVPEVERFAAFAGSSNPGDETWSFRPPDSAAQES